MLTENENIKVACPDGNDANALPDFNQLKPYTWFEISDGLLHVNVAAQYRPKIVLNTSFKNCPIIMELQTIKRDLSKLLTDFVIILIKK